MQHVMLIMHEFQYSYHLSCVVCNEFDWHYFVFLKECFERAKGTVLKDKVVAIMILEEFDKVNDILMLTKQFKSLFF